MSAQTQSTKPGLVKASPKGSAKAAAASKTEETDRPSPLLRPRSQYQLTASDLEVLLALVRSGNLAEAGRRMGANTSTVFRTIQRIEKQLGQALFTRSRAGYFATDLAVQVVAHAEKIESELEAARAISLGTENEVAGRVRVTTTDSILHGILIHS